MERKRGATSAQLRDDIDSGRTGDKVPALDPAAAPLGTDEEAAGTPTPAQAVAMNRRAERREHLETAASDHASGDQRRGPGAMTVLVLVVLVGLSIGWFAFA
jgi:hypothetical protein